MHVEIRFYIRFSGRVTRARRNMENVKKTPPDTPPRHREARNTFKRIQTVVDSESE